MFSDEFTPDYAEFLKKYPAGSEGWAKAFKILGWYETVGILHKHGLINDDLLFDWMAANDAWDRMKGIGSRPETRQCGRTSRRWRKRNRADGRARRGRSSVY